MQWGRQAASLTETEQGPVALGCPGLHLQLYSPFRISGVFCRLPEPPGHRGPTTHTQNPSHLVCLEQADQLDGAAVKARSVALSPNPESWGGSTSQRWATGLEKGPS